MLLLAGCATTIHDCDANIKEGDIIVYRNNEDRPVCVFATRGNNDVNGCVIAIIRYR